MARAHAYRLIDAAETVNSLSPIGDKLPENEAQARPLASLETPEERQEVWTEAVETAPEGKITVAHVERVVSKHIEEKAAPAPKSEPPKKPQTIAPKCKNFLTDFSIAFAYAREGEGREVQRNHSCGLNFKFLPFGEKTE